MGCLFFHAAPMCKQLCQLLCVQGLVLGPSTALTCTADRQPSVGLEPNSYQGHPLSHHQLSTLNSVGSKSELEPSLAATSAGIRSAGPDYIAIAALRHALRPKFEWAEPGLQLSTSSHAAQCNLFGQLVCNDRESEGVGLAAGHEVLIPPKSAFLISDIRRLEPLVQGRYAG